MVRAHFFDRKMFFAEWTDAFLSFVDLTPVFVGELTEREFPFFAEKEIFVDARLARDVAIRREPLDFAFELFRVEVFSRPVTIIEQPL